VGEVDGAWVDEHQRILLSRFIALSKAFTTLLSMYVSHHCSGAGERQLIKLTVVPCLLQLGLGVLYIANASLETRHRIRRAININDSEHTVRTSDWSLARVPMRPIS
jgi:hypothetical protein